MSDELFTTTMKKATRKVHAVSDALVNAKLVFALNNNKVWAEGLIIFYEIFKFLEFAMNKKKDENLGKLNVEGMSRTAAFEADLTHYLGPDWKKDYKVRESVQDYVNHLKHLLETDSDLMMAYVYHMYMALFSGGQILTKKRQWQSKLTNSGNGKGEAVTSFGNANITDLKNELRNRMNAIAEGLTEEKKAQLVEESKKVFELNNSIIRTVSTGRTSLRNFSVLFGSFVLMVTIIYHYYKLIFGKSVQHSS